MAEVITDELVQFCLRRIKDAQQNHESKEYQQGMIDLLEFLKEWN